MVVVAFAKRTTHDALDNDCREASFRQGTQWTIQLLGVGAAVIQKK
jgi:hypothetical protein